MIEQIIEILKNGGLIALPTDTIYGLIGDPSSKAAVERAYELKNRDRSKKLSIFLDSREKIKDICHTNDFIVNFINNELENNTIILEKKDKNYLSLISDNTIGIRIPNNDFIIDFLKVYGKPIFATSINISGQKECLSYEDVLRNFSDKIDLILQNNTIPSNRASNVFKIEGNKIIKVR